MANSKIIYIKNPSNGSHFRTIGKGGGGGGPRKRGSSISIPKWVYKLIGSAWYAFRNPAYAHAQNTNHKNPQVTTKLHMGGFNTTIYPRSFPAYNTSTKDYFKSIGIASADDWKRVAASMAFPSAQVKAVTFTQFTSFLSFDKGKVVMQLPIVADRLPGNGRYEQGWIESAIYFTSDAMSTADKKHTPWNGYYNNLLRYREMHGGQ